MNDRLEEVSTWALEESEMNGGADQSPNRKNRKNSKKRKHGETAVVDRTQTKKQNLMKLFLLDVDSIKEDIKAVKEATKEIGDLNDKALVATTTRDEKEVSRKLQLLVQSTSERAKRTKTLISSLKEESKKLVAIGKINKSDARVRENLCNTLTRKFIDEMKLYQSAQQKFKTDIQKKVTRQVKVVKPDATGEEIDAVMRSEGGRDALYQQCILAGGVNDQVKTIHAKVVDKYNDVLALEGSVAELHQLFLDLTILVEHQGQTVDEIEFHVKETADYIEEGNTNIYKGIRFQRKIRKKQRWIILIAVALVLVVVVLV